MFQVCIAISDVTVYSKVYETDAYGTHQYGVPPRKHNWDSKENSCYPSQVFPLHKNTGAEDWNMYLSQVSPPRNTRLAVNVFVPFASCVPPKKPPGHLLSIRFLLGMVCENFEMTRNISVLLKASPWKGVVRFGKKGKLALRFVGPFEIIEKVCPVAYRLDLHEELNGVHDTFHVSNLKKCLADPTLKVPLDEIRVDAKLNFVEEPVEILEREFKKLKHSRIAIVKVRWNSKRGPEFTWEREDQMKLKYPHLFSDISG
ncbi:hypothetical protein Tco_1203232 [Tanacetum coccineum]